MAAVSTLEPGDLEEFDTLPPQVRHLLTLSLGLTRMNLGYVFGSADPTRGGMDCSGTVFHALGKAGVKGAPRQSDEMCAWVAEKTLLHRVDKADSLTHAEFASLRPGDLLFWSGTYETATPRKVPVTHVMIYLGRLKKGGRPVMFGASDGRVYQGEKRSGVSVFDFNLPKPGGTARFYGYGLIPGIGAVQPPASPAAAAAVPQPPPAEASTKEEVRPAQPAGTGSKTLPPASKKKAAPAAKKSPSGASGAKKAATPKKSG